MEGAGPGPVAGGSLCGRLDGVLAPPGSGPLAATVPTRVDSIRSPHRIPMPADLITITVNYGLADAVLSAMDDVMAALDAAGGGEYWIVDNCSPDDSVAVLRAGIAARPDRDRIRLLESDRNGGFGAGNNVAIRAALNLPEPPRYLYFLNPDAVPRPGAIRTLKDFLDSHPDAGVAGSALCDGEGRITHSAFRFPSFWSELNWSIQLGVVSRLLRRHTVPLDLGSEPEAVDWVSGASFMVRRDVLEQVGGFDEGFFLYWEETELCHRIGATGRTIHSVPEAVVAHDVGASTGMNSDGQRRPRYWFESRRHFYRATGRIRWLGLANVLVLGGLLLRRLHQVVRGRRMDPPHLVRDFLRYGF